MILSYRTEAFNSLFGQHMRANHLDVISIADIENVVNTAGDNRYTAAEIMLLLQVNEKIPITKTPFEVT